jgi:Domain of unknown function (DUF4411)
MLGSPDELPLGLEFKIVCIVDSSVLIKLKRLVAIDDQWDLLLHMSEFVRSGHLAFPRQVAKELAYGQYPDAPGAWIGSAKRDLRHPQPSEATLRRVLEVAEQLVDAEATDDREVADPYVAAMACEVPLRYPGCRSVVATDDHVDRLPRKLSLVTACQRLSIEHWTPDQFIVWVNGDTDNPDWPGGDPILPPSSQ